MAKCAYFYDKITGKIVGVNIHHEKDPDNPGRLKSADCNLGECWEDIRAGRKWPHILDAVTDRNPDNLELVYADDIQGGYNEFKPSLKEGTTRLERRPYFCLEILPNDKLLKSEEKERHCLHEVNTEGGVTLDMRVSVKTTQEDLADHAKDKDIKGVDRDLLIECDYGRLTPRDGMVRMKNGKATFQWHLPDDTSKEPARCYVKDPSGEFLISKSLRVKCC
jgi:hypothetical protein